MDLSVSPEIEAYLSYAIVLALGAWTGGRQVSTRLGGIRRLWLMPPTWLLFVLYVAVPVGLFWLLDRTGTINDTSLFAAILVGFGYERIMGGSSDAIPAPAQASTFWTPFVAYADGLAQRVREQFARNEARRDELIIGAIVEDPQRYDALQTLARSRSPDIQSLDAQLAAIDQMAATVGEAAVRERKTRLLYGTMITLADGTYLMESKKIVTSNLRWFRVWGDRKLLEAGILGALILILGGFTVLHFFPGFKDGIAQYYLWRIGKKNTTSYDQFRSRQNLLALMHPASNGDPDQSPEKLRDSIIEELSIILRRPGLPMERVDFILQTVLESSARPGDNPKLPMRLVDALRAENVDARTHINNVLLFLADSCKPKPTEQDLQLPKGDSAVLLEKLIQQWSAFWPNCRPPQMTPAAGF